MLPLTDSRWREYTTALGNSEDVSWLIRDLLSTGGSARIWEASWNYLVYQDQIAQVSYAAVPYLALFIQRSPQIDWNALALIAAIGIAQGDGPPIPSELECDYHATIESLPMLLAGHSQKTWDELTTRCAASCIALARGQPQLAKVYLEMSLDDANAWFKSQSD